MERLTLTQAVNQIASAYASFDSAKEDRDDVINSALDAYFGEIEATDKKAFRAAKSARKTEAKNIKKLAKAMTKGAKEEAKEEAENMTGLIEELG